MNTNYAFANETFTINPDVYFTVDTTVIHGHRICKLKSLKIYYHGELFEITKISEDKFGFNKFRANMVHKWITTN